MVKKQAKKKKKTIKIKKKPEKKELFYIGVRNAVDIRRNILESTKEFVQVLQMYESYAKLRPEILKKTEKLQSDIQMIKRWNSRLKRILPETGLRAEPIKKKKPEKKLKEGKPEKPASELEKLESELNIIESRLSKIK